MINDTKNTLKIIVDSREQAPLSFDKYPCDWNIDKLDAGDYSIHTCDRPRDDNSIIIERKKDCKELITNLVANWETFKAELVILSQYKHKAIVVCGPNNFQNVYSMGFTRVSPNFIYCRLADVFMEYGIPTIFAGTREDAENIIYRMFTKALKLNEE